MKKNFIIFSLIFASLGVLFYLFKKNEAPKQASWDTFEKTEKNQVVHRKSTKKDLEEINAQKVPPANRRPASIPTREIIGGKGPVHSFINSPSKDWKQKLGHELLNHRLDGSKVLIKELTSGIRIEKGKGRYVERVIVTTTTAEGRQYSFNALADSETGKVLATWNPTIHEDFINKPTGMSAQPIY